MEGISPLRVAAIPDGGVKPILEGRAEVAGQILALAPGAAVEARVVGRITRDVVLLDIAGQLFQTSLPESVSHESNERLPLIVVRGGDKPAFLLDRAATEPHSTPSTRVELSTLASRLDAAVTAATKGLEAAPAATAVAPPLLQQPPADAEGLVPPLRQAVEGSGLFYESHQAEWVAGRRSLESLRAEPQALAASAAQPPEDATSNIENRSAAATGSSASAAHAETTANQSAPTVPSLIAQLVDRQLQTLSGQPVVWTGQVWPGQAMEWVIEEDRNSGQPDAPAETWTSRMRLTLPNLGEVELRVGLRDDRLAVRVVSGEAHVLSFRESAEVLRAALTARGLSLTRLEVAPVGEAG